LLNGKGDFPTPQKTLDFESEIVKTDSEEKPLPKIKLENKVTNKPIDRIVIFYSDGSFKNFEN
jgi:hypothetical protein